MSNGLFEKCYQEQTPGIPVCERFLWPNAVNGTAACKCLYYVLDDKIDVFICMFCLLNHCLVWGVSSLDN